MHDVRRSVEAVTRNEFGSLIADRDIESSSCDIRRLSMWMLMQCADRAGLEFHAHHHEISAVSKHLSTHTFTSHIPRDVCAKYKRRLITHLFAHCASPTDATTDAGAPVDERTISSASSS